MNQTFFMRKRRTFCFGLISFPLVDCGLIFYFKLNPYHIWGYSLFDLIMLKYLFLILWFRVYLNFDLKFEIFQFFLQNLFKF